MACAASTLARPASTRGSGGSAPTAGAHPTAAAPRPAPPAGPHGRPFGSSRWTSGSAGAPANIWIDGTSALRLAAPAAPRTGAAAGRRGRVAAAAAGPNGSASLNGSGSAGTPGNGIAHGPAAVEHFDFIVLGSGIAGLSYALKVAQYGRVAVITKAAADEGCTAYAQGGICAVLDPLDSVEAHVHDTMVAGAWLNDRNAVDVVCREGPRYVLELAKFGAEFTRSAGGDLHLTREGGHSARRIVHAADATGAEIERALVATARANPSIQFFEHHLATDLLSEEVGGVRYCLGADVLDQQQMRMTRFVAPVTMLATGGAGQVYPNTTNPAVTTGDGIAMAYRAKAAVANMEFVQFHPTSLYAPACPGYGVNGAGALGGRSFLITEAVRGEGGMLFNLGGERFMPRYDERLELAPRDIVARSIQAEMRGRGESHVLLDISHKPRHAVLDHFPNVAAHCASLGVDITQDPIPVVPAQHYLCGGVQTGLLGETRLMGLYACGEVACSGLHGANRLASNSLLEGLVFANRAVGPSVAHAEHARRAAAGALRSAAGSADFSGGSAPRPLPASAAAWVADKRRELTGLMWSAAGIVRRQADMKAALQSISQLHVEVKALCQSYGVNTELVELRNLVTVGELIMSSALQRRESRGGHYCEDFPQEVSQERRATVISKGGPSRRPELASIATSGKHKSKGKGSTSVAVPAGHLFGGPLAPPASPKAGRGSGGAARDLLTTRSAPEEE